MNKISQYVPLDEDEHKEIDRTHNLNSARTFFYQGEAECDANMKVFINCIDAVEGMGTKMSLAFWLAQTCNLTMKIKPKLGITRPTVQ